MGAAGAARHPRRMRSTTVPEPSTTTTPEVAPAPAASNRLRVVVADDHPLYRAGIVRALESSEAFDVVAEAGDGRAALEQIRALRPDVALLDVRMPGLDGIDVVAALARGGPDVPVVLLSAFDDEPLVRAGLQAGAAAYLAKTADRDVICLDVAAAARAHGARTPGALRGTPDLEPQRLRGWTPRLTVDEHALLRAAADGASRAELAAHLGIDEPGLRRRIDGVLTKLAVDGLDEAVAVARACGLVR